MSTTQAPPSPSPPISEQISGAVEILQEISTSETTQDLSATKRIFAEVIRNWPGDVNDLWWKWFAESARSLGVRSRILDCTGDEAFRLYQLGKQLVCYSYDSKSAESRWLWTGSIDDGHPQLFCSNGESRSISLKTSQLEKEFKQRAASGTVRCVVLRPNEGLAVPHLAHEEKPTPVQRLSMLLRPETSDICLVLVFAFVVSLLMLATPIAVEALVNTVAFGRVVQPIIVLALILLMFLGFQGAVRALQTYVVEIIQRRLFARVAGDLAYRLPRTEMAATDGRYAPELVNRFFDIVTVQKVAAQLLLDGIGLGLGALIGMVVLAFYHPWLLGFDIFLLFSIAIIIFVLGRGAVTSSVKESKHKYFMASWLQDIARCSTTFRNAGGTEFALERTDRLVHDYLDARRVHFRILMRQIIFALGLQAIASTLLLGLGGWLVLSGELTLGQLVAAELIVTVVVGSFAKFGKHMESFYDLLASVDKLGQLFDLETEPSIGILAIDQYGPVAVELNEVSYTWPESSGSVGKLSTMIAPGERFAILGPAGSGKSTLVDLISGLRKPTTGYVRVKEFDPRDLRTDVRRRCIAVARESEPVHATIEENVHLHREQVTATHVRNILDAVGILEPILKLKEGCRTILSSSGAPLSGNQQKLLSIARAAAGQPSLLLIDGTLDSLGDQEIDNTLRFLMSEDHPWTLVLTTSRRDIADRFTRQLTLD